MARRSGTVCCYRDSNYSIIAFGDNKEIQLDDNLTIVTPAGGAVNTGRFTYDYINRDCLAVTDSEGGAAKTVRIGIPYTVNKGNETNGSFTVSAEKALAGDEITVTATPAEGYAAQKMTYTDGSGTENTISNSNNAGTFTMPEADVTVNVTFVRKADPDTEAAEKVTELINALPASGSVTTADKKAIEAARAAYDALTEEQKAKVSKEALTKLKVAEKALAEAVKKSVTSVSVSAKTVTAKTISAAIAKAGGSSKYVTKIVLGKNVKKISKGAFKNCSKVKTLVVKSKKLKKASVKNALKGSKVNKVKVKVGSKQVFAKQKQI